MILPLKVFRKDLLGPDKALVPGLVLAQWGHSHMPLQCRHWSEPREEERSWQLSQISIPLQLVWPCHL